MIEQSLLNRQAKNNQRIAQAFGGNLLMWQCGRMIAACLEQKNYAMLRNAPDEVLHAIGVAAIHGITYSLRDFIEAPDKG